MFHLFRLAMGQFRWHSVAAFGLSLVVGQSCGGVCRIIWNQFLLRVRKGHVCVVESLLGCRHFVDTVDRVLSRNQNRQGVPRNGRWQQWWRQQLPWNHHKHGKDSSVCDLQATSKLEGLHNLLDEALDNPDDWKVIMFCKMAVDSTKVLMSRKRKASSAFKKNTLVFH